MLDRILRSIRDALSRLIERGEIADRARGPLRVDQVFTRGTDVLPDIYVHRGLAESRLDAALRSDQPCAILYGNWKCGKSTLCRQTYRAVFRGEPRPVTCQQEWTYSDLIAKVLEALGYSLVAERKQGTSAEVGVDYFLTATGTASTEAIRRPVMGTLGLDNVVAAMETARLGIALEEFHNLPSVVRQQFVQQLDALRNQAVSRTTKLVMIGRADSSQELATLPPSLDGRIPAIRVPVMTREDLTLILQRGARLLNLDIPTSLVEQVIAYCPNYSALTCHTLAAEMCRARGISERSAIRVTLSQRDLQDALQVAEISAPAPPIGEVADLPQEGAAMVLDVKAGRIISNTATWSDEGALERLAYVRGAFLDWDGTSGSARKWWQAFEEVNKARPKLVLRLAEELALRSATITEFFLAYVYSNTDNIQANLYYLDYTRLKKQEEKKKKAAAAQDSFDEAMAARNEQNVMEHFRAVAALDGGTAAEWLRTNCGAVLTCGWYETAVSMLGNRSRGGEQ